MKILVTGASGFIGSFIVEHALTEGMEVWAGIRSTSSHRYLNNDHIHFIELDFDNPDQLNKQLLSHFATNGKWDYIVHAAGATKCLHRKDFFETNTKGTKNLMKALIACDMPPEMFVYISSLSVFGPVREQQPYTDIMDADTPMPDTAYGESKLKSEEFLDMFENFPHIILRPTGVYGPREKDYFMMVKSIKGHTDFAVGYKSQELTFVYVLDLVQAIFLALKKGKSGKKYFVSDGNVYSSRTFSDLICKELNIKWVLRIKAPIWLLRIVTLFGEYIGKISGRVTALNNDKYYIMKQRNWRCDISPMMKELGYKPEYNLKQGVKLTIEWYKKEGWL
jgi:nucleoside-diphosphate-sugar epimerase